MFGGLGSFINVQHNKEPMGAHTYALLIHTRYKLFLGVFKITRVEREKSDHTFGSTIKKANPDSIQMNLIQRLYKLKLFL